MKLSPFAASTIGVLLLLSVGLFGPSQLTGRVIDIEPVLQQLQEKTEASIQSAKKTLSPGAQENYDLVMEEAMQRVDQSVESWAQKAAPLACKTLQQSTNADLFVKQAVAQLSRSMQGVAKQVLTDTIKKTIIISQGDPAAQQKIADAQVIATASYRLLVIYASQQVLASAIKECPEELPPSAADVLPETRATKRAVSAVQTTQEGVDVAFRDVLFYYEDSRNMWVDKDQLEPRARLMPEIGARNVGTVEAKDVEIAVSVDGGTEEIQKLGKMPLGASMGKGFFLPAGLLGGQHELSVRIIAKDDVNLENNLAKIPFTIIVDGVIRDLKFSYVNEQRSILSTPVDTNAVNPALQLVATVYVTNEGRTALQKADVIMTIDNGPEQRQVAYSRSGYVSFDIKNLAPGKHDITFKLDVRGDTNPINNEIKSSITITDAEKPQAPTPPVVEQPKPLPVTPQPAPTQPKEGIDVAFKDAIFYNKYDLKTPLDKNAMEETLDKIVDVTVTNVGSKEAKILDVFVREDDRSFEVKRFLTSDLQPGTSKTRQFLQSDTFPSSLGPHKLVFRIETQGDINSANNVGIVNYNVVSTPEPQPAPKPTIDFSIAKLDYKQNLVSYVGDLLSPFVSIKLIVYIPLDLKYDLPETTLRVLVNDKIVADNVPVKSFIFGHPPAGRIFGEVPVDIGSFSPGEHKIQVIIDPNNKVKEIYEDNNQLPVGFGFTVGEEKLGDAVIEWDTRVTPEGNKWLYQDKRLLPNELVPDKDTELYVHVRNAGTADITPKIVAEIDGKEVASKDAGTIKPNEFDKALILQLGKLTAGKHTLTVTAKVDKDKNPVSNTITATLDVVAPEIKLLPSSRAEFNDATAKSTRKNTIQIFIDNAATGRVPAQMALSVYAGDKGKLVIMEPNKQTIATIDVERNKFPTHIYVRADIEDADKTNNALLIPVVIIKDGRMYELS